jgi:hypothetical protein
MSSIPPTRRVPFVVALAVLLAALPAVASHHLGPPAGHPGTAGPGGAEGLVLESMNAGGYTYVRVKSAEGEVWAAGPLVAVDVGDRVRLVRGVPMKDFHSDSLDRTFESIRFVTAIEVVARSGGGSAEEIVADVHGKGASHEAGNVEPVARAEGGFTIEEIFARSSELDGAQVSVRGRVVKFSAKILGRNWIHIQDGTGGDGTDDLTVTSSSVVEPGQVVLVRGTVAVDRDFGMGYHYELLIEEATVTAD